jgi:hypothetical protein
VFCSLDRLSGSLRIENSLITADDNASLSVLRSVGRVTEQQPFGFSGSGRTNFTSRDDRAARREMLPLLNRAAKSSGSFVLI